MNQADLINGLFEALAGIFILNHCRVLLRDRTVAGVSIASTAFFSLWGVWNLWYYPNLGQSWSFLGGLVVVTANTAYVALLVRFSNVCRFLGCNYDTLVFHPRCLYFCTRCGKEATGRTFDDLAPMTDEDMEEMHHFEQIYRETQA